MQSARPILATVILLLFVGVSILGLGMSMMTDAQGHMSNCPLMNGLSSICKMNVFDHLSKWQSLFVALAPTTFSLSLVLFSLAFALIVFAALYGSASESSLRTNPFHRQEPSAWFDPLRIALAQGILHPKIYDTVAIR